MSEKQGRVPSGYYMAKAVPVTLPDDTTTYVQLGLSKKSGSKQALVMFQIEGGEYDGVKLPWFGYFTKDSAERTIQAFRLMGWQGSKLASLMEEKLDDRVSVTVENDTYEGKTRSRVSWVNDANGPQLVLDRPITDKALADLEKTLADYL